MLYCAVVIEDAASQACWDWGQRINYNTENSRCLGHGLMSETKKQESKAEILTDSTPFEGMLGCFPFICRATLICELRNVKKNFDLWDAIILLEVMGSN